MTPSIPIHLSRPDPFPVRQFFGEKSGQAKSGDKSADKRMRARDTRQYVYTHTKKFKMEAKNCHERVLSRIFHVSLTTGIVLILVLKDTGNADENL